MNVINRRNFSVVLQKEASLEGLSSIEFEKKLQELFVSYGDNLYAADSLKGRFFRLVLLPIELRASKKNIHAKVAAAWSASADSIKLSAELRARFNEFTVKNAGLESQESAAPVVAELKEIRDRHEEVKAEQLKQRELETIRGSHIQLDGETVDHAEFVRRFELDGKSGLPLTFLEDKGADLEAREKLNRSKTWLFEQVQQVLSAEDQQQALRKLALSLSQVKALSFSGSYGVQPTVNDLIGLLKKLPKNVLDRLPLQVKQLVEHDGLQDPEAFARALMKEHYEPLKDRIPKLPGVVDAGLSVLEFDNPLIPPRGIAPEVVDRVFERLLGNKLGDLAGQIPWIGSLIQLLRVVNPSYYLNWADGLIEEQISQIGTAHGLLEDKINPRIQAAFAAIGQVLPRESAEWFGVAALMGHGPVRIDVEENEQKFGYKVTVYPEGELLAQLLERNPNLQWPIVFDEVPQNLLDADFWALMLHAHMGSSLKEQAPRGASCVAGILESLNDYRVDVEGGLKAKKRAALPQRPTQLDSELSIFLPEMENPRLDLWDYRYDTLVQYAASFKQEDSHRLALSVEVGKQLQAAIEALVREKGKLGKALTAEQIATIAHITISLPDELNRSLKDKMSQGFEGKLQSALMSLGVSKESLTEWGDLAMWVGGSEIGDVVDQLTPHLPTEQQIDEYKAQSLPREGIESYFDLTGYRLQDLTLRKVVGALFELRAFIQAVSSGDVSQSVALAWAHLPGVRHENQTVRLLMNAGVYGYGMVSAIQRKNHWQAISHARHLYSVFSPHFPKAMRIWTYRVLWAIKRLVAEMVLGVVWQLALKTRFKGQLEDAKEKLIEGKKTVCRAVHGKEELSFDGIDRKVPIQHHEKLPYRETLPKSDVARRSAPAPQLPSSWLVPSDLFGLSNLLGKFSFGSSSASSDPDRLEMLQWDSHWANPFTQLPPEVHPSQRGLGPHGVKFLPPLDDPKLVKEAIINLPPASSYKWDWIQDAEIARVQRQITEYAQKIGRPSKKATRAQYEELLACQFKLLSIQHRLALRDHRCSADTGFEFAPLELLIYLKRRKVAMVDEQRMDDSMIGESTQLMFDELQEFWNLDPDAALTLKALKARSANTLFAYLHLNEGVLGWMTRGFNPWAKSAKNTAEWRFMTKLLQEDPVLREEFSAETGLDREEDLVYALTFVESLACRKASESFVPFGYAQLKMQKLICDQWLRQADPLERVEIDERSPNWRMTHIMHMEDDRWKVSVTDHLGESILNADHTTDLELEADRSQLPVGSTLWRKAVSFRNKCRIAQGQSRRIRAAGFPEDLTSYGMPRDLARLVDLSTPILDVSPITEDDEPLGAIDTSNKGVSYLASPHFVGSFVKLGVKGVTALPGAGQELLKGAQGLYAWMTGSAETQDSRALVELVISRKRQIEAFRPGVTVSGKVFAEVEPGVYRLDGVDHHFEDGRLTKVTREVDGDAVELIPVGHDLRFQWAVSYPEYELNFELWVNRNTQRAFTCEPSSIEFQLDESMTRIVSMINPNVAASIQLPEVEGMEFFAQCPGYELGRVWKEKGSDRVVMFDFGSNQTLIHGRLADDPRPNDIAHHFAWAGADYRVLVNDEGDEIVIYQVKGKYYKADLRMVRLFDYVKQHHTSLTKVIGWTTTYGNKDSRRVTLSQDKPMLGRLAAENIQEQRGQRPVKSWPLDATRAGQVKNRHASASHGIRTESQSYEQPDLAETIDEGIRLQAYSQVVACEELSWREALKFLKDHKSAWPFKWVQNVLQQIRLRSAQLDQAPQLRQELISTLDEMAAKYIARKDEKKLIRLYAMSLAFIPVLKKEGFFPCEWLRQFERQWEVDSPELKACYVMAMQHDPKVYSEELQKELEYQAIRYLVTGSRRYQSDKIFAALWKWRPNIVAAETSPVIARLCDEYKLPYSEEISLDLEKGQLCYRGRDYVRSNPFSWLVSDIRVRSFLGRTSPQDWEIIADGVATLKGADAWVEFQDEQIRIFKGQGIAVDCRLAQKAIGADYLGIDWRQLRLYLQGDEIHAENRESGEVSRFKVKVNGDKFHVLHQIDPARVYVGSAEQFAQLAPLTRFCPLKDIKCWTDPATGELVEFEARGRRFTVREHNGRKRAFLGEQFISQDQTHQALEGLPSYLILEDEHGNKRALLGKGQQIAAASWRVFKKLPLGADGAQALAGKRAARYCTEYHTVSLGKDGSMGVDSLVVLADLVSTYLAMGKIEQARLTVDEIGVRIRTGAGVTDQELKALEEATTLVSLCPQPIVETRLTAARLSALCVLAREESSGTPTMATVAVRLGNLMSLMPTGLYKKLDPEDQWLLFEDLRQCLKQVVMNVELKSSSDRSFQGMVGALPEVLANSMRGPLLEVLCDEDLFGRVLLPKLAPELAEDFRQLSKRFAPPRAGMTVRNVVEKLAMYGQAMAVLQPLFMALGSIRQEHQTMLVNPIPGQFDYWLGNQGQMLSILKRWVPTAINYFSNPDLLWLEGLRHRLESYEGSLPLPREIGELTYQGLNAERFKGLFPLFYCIMTGDTILNSEGLQGLHPSFNRENLARILPQCLAGFDGDAESAAMAALLYRMSTLPEPKNTVHQVISSLFEGVQIPVYPSWSSLTKAAQEPASWKKQIKRINGVIGLHECMPAVISKIFTRKLWKAVPALLRVGSLTQVRPSRSEMQAWAKRAGRATQQVIETLFSKVAELSEADEELVATDVAPLPHIASVDSAADVAFDQLFSIAFERKADGIHYNGQSAELIRLYFEANQLYVKSKRELDGEYAQILEYLNQLCQEKGYFDLSAGEEITEQDLDHFLLSGEVSEKLAHCQLSEFEQVRLDRALARLAAKKNRMVGQLKRLITPLERVVGKLAKEGYAPLHDSDLDTVAKILTMHRVWKNDEAMEPRMARALLVFEKRNNALLHGEQISLFKQQFADNKGKRRSIEALMGIGKTWLFGPLGSRLLADKTRLQVSVHPRQLVDNNTRTGARQSAGLGKRDYRLTWDRQDAPDIQQLSRILGMHRNALRQGHGLHTTRWDLSAMQLQMLLCCHHGNEGTKGEHAAAFDMLKEILGMYGSCGARILDESHQEQKPNEELVWPLNKECRVPGSEYTVIDAVMGLVIQDVRVKEALSIGRLASLKEDYPLICQQVARRLFLHTRERLGDASDVQDFIDYVTTPAAQPAPWIVEHPRKNEIDMVRGVLAFGLEACLDQVLHSSFAYSESEDEPFAKPAVGNSTPKADSLIKMPHMTLIKSFLLYGATGLTEEKKQQVLAMLEQRAHRQAESAECAPEYTEAGRKKALMEGRELTDPKLISFYMEKFVWPKVVFWKKSLNLTTQEFIEMFAEHFGQSGTPYNSWQFGPTVDKILFPETAARATDLITSNCLNRDQIDPLDSEMPQDVVVEIVETYFKQRGAVLLVDGGELLRGLSCDEVAKIMWENRAAHVQAIRFYRGSEVYSLEAGGVVPLWQSKVSAKDAWNYLDGPHGFGADLKLAPDAIGVNTIGENDTAYKKRQEGFRLRGIAKKSAIVGSDTGSQKLYYTTTQWVKRNICQDETLTADKVWRFAQEREDQELKRGNYTALCQMYKTIVRRQIIKLMLEADFKTACGLLKRYSHVLMSSLATDPSALYGGRMAEMETVTALQKLEAWVLDSCPDRVAAQKSIATVRAHTVDKGMPLPEKVKVMVRQDRTIDPSFTDELGAESTVQTQTQEDGIAEEEEEQEAQSQVNTQQQSALTSRPEAGPGPFSEWKWNNHVDYRDGRWLAESSKYTTRLPEVEIPDVDEPTVMRAPNPSVFAMRDAAMGTSLPAVRAIHDAIDPRLMITNNALPTQTHSMDEHRARLGTELARRVSSLLVYAKEEAGQLKIERVVQLSLKDVAHFQRAIAEGGSNGYKAFIWDPKLQVVTAGDYKESGMNAALKEHEDLGILTMQARLLSGDFARYHGQEDEWTRAWITKMQGRSFEYAMRAISFARQAKILSGGYLDTILEAIRKASDTGFVLTDEPSVIRRKVVSIGEATEVAQSCAAAERSMADMYAQSIIVTA